MIVAYPHDDRERDLLLYMLGLNLTGRTHLSHRNYFAADPASDDDLTLAGMAQAGLVKLRRRPTAVFSYNFYVVTTEGKDAVRRFFGEFREAKA